MQSSVQLLTELHVHFLFAEKIDEEDAVKVWKRFKS